MPCFECKECVQNPDWHYVPAKSIHDWMPQDIQKFTWHDGYWWYFICWECRLDHHIDDVPEWMEYKVSLRWGSDDGRPWKKRRLR